MLENQTKLTSAPSTSTVFLFPITVRNRGGRTPLHFAAENGYFQICQYILDRIEDKNPRDIAGKYLIYGTE